MIRFWKRRKGTEMAEQVPVGPADPLTDLLAEVSERLGRIPWTADDLTPGETARFLALDRLQRLDFFAPAVALAKLEAHAARQAEDAERERVRAERLELPDRDAAAIELGEALDLLAEAIRRDDVVKQGFLRQRAVIARAALVVAESVDPRSSVGRAQPA